MLLTVFNIIKKSVETYHPPLFNFVSSVIEFLNKFSYFAQTDRHIILRNSYYVQRHTIDCVNNVLAMNKQLWKCIVCIHSPRENATCIFEMISKINWTLCTRSAGIRVNIEHKDHIDYTDNPEVSSL